MKGERRGRMMKVRKQKGRWSQKIQRWGISVSLSVDFYGERGDEAVAYPLSSLRQ